VSVFRFDMSAQTGAPQNDCCISEVDKESKTKHSTTYTRSRSKIQFAYDAAVFSVLPEISFAKIN